MGEQGTKPNVVESVESSGRPIEAQLKRRNRLWLLIGGGVLTLLIIAAIVMEGLTIKKLSNRLDRVEWEQILTQRRLYEDTIVAEVNTIQFLKHNYTIEFEQVSFTQEGLRLSGYLGNSTNLFLHTVSLKFSALKYPSFDEYKKKEKDSSDIWWIIYDASEEIGNAQAEAIGMILPGQREHFQVTIPNVHQTKEGFKLTVKFSGERYSYR
jgi:hypothetical protein